MAGGNTILDVTFTLEHMDRFAYEAWGELGREVVYKWREFNETYFGNALKPVPLVITNTQPFGKRLAFCSYDPNASGRTITLNVPKQQHAGRRYQLLADNNTLLHEMVHQFLFERGEDAAHLSSGWRREIMRLTKQITGKDIWCGASRTVRQNGGVVRINLPNKDTGAASLPQKVIARWPHDELGIDFGCLGGGWDSHHD
jgi:hypothetical protein